MVERIQAQPEVFFLGCFVFVPVAVWTISVIGWMVMGEMDFLGGLVMISVALGMGYLTIAPPAPYVSVVCFIGVCGLVVFFPFVRGHLTRRAMVKIDLEQLERLHEQVRMRPDNKAAKFKIADLLYRLGFVNHAVGLGDALAPEMPKDLYPEELRTLRQWHEANRGRSLFGALGCPRCGAYNPPGDMYCAQCGDEYLLNLARGGWFRGSWAMKVLAGWVVGMIAAAGIPAVGATDWPGPVKIVVVVFLMGAGAYVLLRSFLTGVGGVS